MARSRTAPVTTHPPDAARWRHREAIEANSAFDNAAKEGERESLDLGFRDQGDVAHHQDENGFDERVNRAAPENVANGAPAGRRGDFTPLAMGVIFVMDDYTKQSEFRQKNKAAQLWPHSGVKRSILNQSERNCV